MVTKIENQRLYAPLGAGTTIYVDTEAGSDLNTGGVSDPLATIQEAVHRFIPPYGPAPYWARDEVRTISVVYTPGMSPITEFLHIPLHRGEGVLRIAAQEEETYTGLVQSGSLSQGGNYDTDGYYNSHYELTCTTSPFVSGSLTDGYFIRPTLNPNDHSTEFSFEQAAVINNTANTLDIVIYQPGSYLGFGYGNTMGFDVVRPQVVWSPPDDQGFTFAGGPLITMDGGFNEFSGFRFAPLGSSGGARVLFHSRATSSVNSFGISTTISRCTFEASSDTIYVVEGSGVSLAGCYFDITTGGFTVFKNGSGLNIFNSRFNHAPSSLSSITLMVNCTESQVAGLSYRGNDSSSSSNALGLYIVRTTGADIALGVDIRNCRSGFLANSGRGNFTNCSIADVGINGFTCTNFELSIDSITVQQADAGMQLSSCIFVTISNSLFSACDDGLQISNAYVAVFNSNFESCLASGIDIEDHSQLLVGSDVVGSSNGSFGVEMRRNCVLRISSASTLSGATADVRLGAVNASVSGGDQTDTQSLCLMDVF